MHTVTSIAGTLLCTLLAASGTGSASEEASGGPEMGALPNLEITSVLITNELGEVISPEAGERFWVRVDYEYSDPSCDYYTIERTVNSFVSSGTPINLGCGTTGTAQWTHVAGSWLMHTAGSYEIEVQLDGGNEILESDEGDNQMTVEIVVGGTVTPGWALVEADAGRRLLGDGTDVLVGSMDGALDVTHPWLTGTDSLGRRRLVAAWQNGEGEGAPRNTSHATAVMGIALARGVNDGDITGMAPDARYVTAEFIDQGLVPGGLVQDPFDAAGFLVDNGAEIINMSWSWFSDETESRNGEGAVTNLMADYLAYGLDIVCVAAINQLPEHEQPTAPGAARNVLTVGGLDASLTRAWWEQDHGPTRDGRSKPDLLGNNAERSVSLRPGWSDGRPAWQGFHGTSFAAPFVTGGIAQLLDYGKAQGENTDHRVLKAVAMNSGVKILDDDGSPWDNSSAQALDDQQGTGVLNMLRAHAMYSAGQQEGPEVSPKGYDFRTVSGTESGGSHDGCVVYELGMLTGAPAQFDATLVWDRHTYWDDANGNGRIDAFDDFFTMPTDRQDNLDLVLFRNGVEVASSRSTVDNVEHLSNASLAPGVYELHVERLPVPFSGEGEDFAVAWLGEGTWTQNYSRASYTTFGFGCSGTAGTPVLEPVPGSKPWVGGSIQVRLTNLSKDFSFGSAFMALGLSKTDWRGQPLPMDLDDLGLWGCSSYTSVEVAFPLVSFLGNATWSFEIPNHGSLVGTPFFNQGFVLDTDANPAGFIVSNGGEGVIGGG